MLTLKLVLSDRDFLTDSLEAEGYKALLPVEFKSITLLFTGE
jgi:hypothetical protein